jgi:MFS transporter, ACS family, solute carrier family 17 (sodium-dependent inorganic phosphate cotransporter), other
MAIIYGLKVNLSVAMVAMVNHTAVRLSSSHHVEEHTSLANVSKVIEECAAENRSSSSVSQVNHSSYFARSPNDRKMPS